MNSSTDKYNQHSRERSEHLIWGKEKIEKKVFARSRVERENNKEERRKNIENGCKMIKFE